MGLAGIPQPTLLGLKITSHLDFFILASVFCILNLWVYWVVVRSPYGRVLRAIREDELLAESAGKNLAAYKRSVFALGAGLAASAGVIFAHYVSFIDPTSFSVLESIFIISIVIIGGAGSLWGPVVGAVVLVTLPELLRFIGIPSSIAANVRQIIYGASLVACMLWRPQGVIGKFGFRKEERRG